MSDEIQYFITPTGDAFHAFYHGNKIGEITFVRIGADKLIIDYTGVEPVYRRQQRANAD